MRSNDEDITKVNKIVGFVMVKGMKFEVSRMFRVKK